MVKKYKKICIKIMEQYTNDAFIKIIRYLENIIFTDF